MKLHDIDFLIIGATKSATTWLQQSLQQHPGIYMPAPELHYFSRFYDRGDQWYLSNFEGQKDRRLVGEKSNSYMDTEGAAGRISQKLPDAMLIAQLRNPIERAYSDYCMLYRRGEVGRDIAQYLDPRRAAGGRFLSGGLYFQQLRAYFDRFPAEQILVVLYEDMRLDAFAQLDRVRKHLRMADDPPLRPLEKKVKDKAEPMIHPTLRRLLRPLKPIVAPFRNSAGFKRMRSIAAAEVQYAPLTRELRERIGDFYATEIEKLGAIVGRDLNGWLRNGSVRE
ncbi:heparan sulfate glucosamine 3-O-sulfotransferase 3B1 (plasmid) [Sinorhizobium fredii NGR234]|uniref:Heparan sulfate glucosamine 3-O-sulfotransferase 3B1 n=1 Tax=Sinorhizobium fredii (strain NBRC 101917 / NGR234) TaxID=394 RepID=C3KRF9_SINFN|nr:sulfotransferase [Sinorhizobium fredii]ACP22667.1 heparan sulfate glucosamine 3-O-sulfotransferase 3B1 [Sinorhizobium fredii NGR234]